MAFVPYNDRTQRIYTSIQENHCMSETPQYVHTTPSLYIKVCSVHFKETVSTTHTFNTQDTPHILGLRDQALVATVILDTGATGRFITKKYSRIAGLPTLVPSRKMIAVADNIVIKSSHNTQISYKLPPSAMEGDVVPSFSN